MTLHRVSRVAGSLAVAVVLASCSHLPEWLVHDHAQDYLTASTVGLLRVPSGLETPVTQPHYPIPGDHESPAEQSVFELEPPPRLLNPSLGEVRLQRLGDRRWLLVDRPPDRVWPLVRAFFSDSQLPLSQIDARAGLLETDWLQPDNHAPERYRLQLSAGLRSGSSEILLVQHSGGGDWPDIASEVERRDEMLQALATYLVDAPAAAVSRLAASLAAARERARIEDDAQGLPQLLLDLRYERGWPTIAKALERAGFEIVDRDHSAGVFYLLPQPERTPRLSPERRQRPSPQSEDNRSSVDVDQLPPERRLELRVRPDGTAGMISSFHRPGLFPEAARELLEQLRSHLG